MAHQNTLVYWNAKARGWPAAVIAAYGKLPLKWDDATANAWPSTKEKSPFGQLPFITFADGHTVGQSGAIYRVLARKTGLDGGNDFDFNMSQQLIEEYQDIYGALVKPVYIQDAAAKAAAIDDFKTEFAPSQLAHLEKLVGPDGTFSQNGRILVGDILVVCGLNLLLDAGVSLANFPKLKTFYDKHHEQVLGEFAKTPRYATY